MEYSDKSNGHDPSLIILLEERTEAPAKNVEICENTKEAPRETLTLHGMGGILQLLQEGSTARTQLKVRQSLLPP